MATMGSVEQPSPSDSEASNDTTTNVVAVGDPTTTTTDASAESSSSPVSSMSRIDDASSSRHDTPSSPTTTNESMPQSSNDTTPESIEDVNITTGSVDEEKKIGDGIDVDDYKKVDDNDNDDNQSIWKGSTIDPKSISHDWNTENLDPIKLDEENAMIDANGISSIHTNPNITTTTPPRPSPLLPTLQDQWKYQDDDPPSNQHPLQQSQPQQRFLPLPAIHVPPRPRQEEVESIPLSCSLEDFVVTDHDVHTVNVDVDGMNVDADDTEDAFGHTALSMFGPPSPTPTRMHNSSVSHSSTMMTMPPMPPMSMPRLQLPAPMPPISASMFPSSLEFMGNFVPQSVNTAAAAMGDGNGDGATDPNDNGEDEGSIMGSINMEGLEDDDEDGSNDPAPFIGNYFPSPDIHKSVQNGGSGGDTTHDELPQTSHDDPFSTANMTAPVFDMPSSASNDNGGNNMFSSTVMVDRQLLHDFLYGIRNDHVGHGLLAAAAASASASATTTTATEEGSGDAAATSAMALPITMSASVTPPANNPTQVPMPPLLPPSNPSLASDQEPSPLSLSTAATDRVQIGVHPSTNTARKRGIYHSTATSATAPASSIQKSKKTRASGRGVGVVNRNHQSKKKSTRSLPLRKRVNHRQQQQMHHPTTTSVLGPDLCTPTSAEEEEEVVLSDDSRRKMRSHHDLRGGGSISMHPTASASTTATTKRSKVVASSKLSGRKNKRSSSLCRTGTMQMIQFHPSSDSTNTSINTDTRHKCKCSKSKCIKLYCECFQNGALCGIDCVCKDCKNTLAESGPNGARTIAINTTLEKRPDAFYQKFKRTDGGCNCKKNKCVKKYCVCYASGQFCDDKCQCLDCKNVKVTDDESDSEEGLGLVIPQSEMVVTSKITTDAPTFVATTHKNIPQVQRETISTHTSIPQVQSELVDFSSTPAPAIVATHIPSNQVPCQVASI